MQAQIDLFAPCVENNNQSRLRRKWPEIACGALPCCFVVAVFTNQNISFSSYIFSTFWESFFPSMCPNLGRLYGSYFDLQYWSALSKLTYYWLPAKFPVPPSGTKKESFYFIITKKSGEVGLLQVSYLNKTKILLTF